MYRGLWLCALLLGSSGCAAVFKGTKQEVHFESVPIGADVRVDNRYAGVTPVDAEVSRSSSQNIVVSKEGFKEQYVSLQRHPDTPWWFWDIATCVIPVTLCIPILVDAISGAWMSVDDGIRVKLDPAVQVAAPPSIKPASAPTYTPDERIP